MYEQKAAAAGMSYQNVASAPPPATRLSSCAGQLEARLAHVAGLFDRLSRVADRLSGSVPEEANTAGKLQGTPTNTLSQLEQSLEMFDVITRRAERTTERLEAI